MAIRSVASLGVAATSVVGLPDITLHIRSRPAYTMAKRVIDLTGALVLLVMLIPVILIIAVAVVVDSGWPFLYTGTRVGRGARTFRVLKFRSMRVDADASVHRDYLRELLSGQAGALNGLYKVPEDRRITRVGSLLRKTSIDELPQLVNVLRGDMSLVGPRPEVPYALDEYEPWMYRRFEVTPGITGLWQVSGRGKIGVREMLRLDVEYADRCDLGLDLGILARTIPAVLRGTGAG